jgi:NAD(P)-dependent dehydrogenase (short-subunit alcohol dehydrogenase family)
VIASRSGTANEKVQDLVRELQILGATVAVRKCDVSVRSQVEKLFEECSQTMPPIKGVLHGSAVFQVRHPHVFMIDV